MSYYQNADGEKEYYVIKAKEADKFLCVRFIADTYDTYMDIIDNEELFKFKREHHAKAYIKILGKKNLEIMKVTEKEK